MVATRRIGPQIGVEVTDVDVNALDDTGFARIYQAWLDCNVLVVRDQELEIPDFLRYSRRFGPVVPHPSKSTRHPEIPEITMLGVNKFDADGKLNLAIYRRGAEGWHTDGAYNQLPFKATQLYAMAVPSRGGDTLFANGYAAYEALPERLKQRLEGFKAHSHMAVAGVRRSFSMKRTATGGRCSTRSSACIRRLDASRFISIPARSCRSSAPQPKRVMT
jgi:taurine dioxygenase